MIGWAHRVHAMAHQAGTKQVLAMGAFHEVSFQSFWAELEPRFGLDADGHVVVFGTAA